MSHYDGSTDCFFKPSATHSFRLCQPSSLQCWVVPAPLNLLACQSQAKMGGSSHWTALVRGPILRLLASSNLSRRTCLAPRKCKLWQVLGSTMNIYVGCQKAKLHVMVQCFYNHNFFII